MLCIEDVLKLRDADTFRRALHDNLPHWLEAFLAKYAKKSRFRPGVYPQGAFAHVVRSSLAGFRPDGAIGVASGTWSLPCGLTAAEAWKLIQARLAVLNVRDLTARFVGTVAVLAITPAIRPRFDPKSVASTKWSKCKHLKALNASGRTVYGPSGEAIDTRLKGLTAVRFAERLGKAMNKGVGQVCIFLGDLLQLRDRLAKVPDLDFQDLFEVMKAIESAVSAAKSVIRHLRHTTPEDVLAAEARAERTERKRLRKATRSAARQVRQAARRQAVRLARKPAPVLAPVADNVVDLDAIRLSKAEKREARMIDYANDNTPDAEVFTGSGPRNSRRHYTCMKSQRGLPLRRAA